MNLKSLLAAAVATASLAGATAQAASYSYACHGRDHNRQPTRVSLVIDGSKLMMNGQVATVATSPVSGIQSNQTQYNFAQPLANGYLYAYAVRVSTELVAGASSGYAVQQFVGERYLPGDYTCFRQ